MLLAYVPDIRFIFRRQVAGAADAYPLDDVLTDTSPVTDAAGGCGYRLVSSA